MPATIRIRAIKYLQSVLPKTTARQFETLQQDFEQLRNEGEVALRLVVQPDKIRRSDDGHSDRYNCDELWRPLGGGIASMTNMPESLSVMSITGTPNTIVSCYLSIENLRTEKETNRLLESSERLVEVKGKNWGTDLPTNNWSIVVPVPAVSTYRPPTQDALRFGEVAGKSCEGIRLSSLGIGATEGITGLRRWLGVLHLLESSGIFHGVGRESAIADDAVHRMLVPDAERSEDAIDGARHAHSIGSIHHAGFTWTVDKYLRSSSIAAGILADIVNGKLTIDSSIDTTTEAVSSDDRSSYFSDHRGSGASYADPNPTGEYREVDPVSAFLVECEKFIDLRQQEIAKDRSTNWEILSDEAFEIATDVVSEFGRSRRRVRNSLQSLADDVAAIVESVGKPSEPIYGIVMAAEHDVNQFFERWRVVNPLLRAVRRKQSCGEIHGSHATALAREQDIYQSEIERRTGPVNTITSIQQPLRPEVCDDDLWLQLDVCIRAMETVKGGAYGLISKWKIGTNSDAKYLKNINQLADEAGWTPFVFSHEEGLKVLRVGGGEAFCRHHRDSYSRDEVGGEEVLSALRAWREKRADELRARDLEASCADSVPTPNIGTADSAATPHAGNIKNTATKDKADHVPAPITDIKRWDLPRYIRDARLYAKWREGGKGKTGDRLRWFLDDIDYSGTEREWEKLRSTERQRLKKFGFSDRTHNDWVRKLLEYAKKLEVDIDAPGDCEDSQF
ncbi:hypothetical protein Enr13x_48580 [Stieleria neptunia]|uniref:Uncharacterized protein n=1 Tax=Stieleria neptunia TaxID=2527979 RepID=A0A518HVW0_9BACT|nr:hypothetical protein [Stieleria neptunia]QDV44985.1 hypothetical protein Enr13x_48580 [Stieleria neptunia]